MPNVFFACAEKPTPGTLEMPVKTGMGLFSSVKNDSLTKIMENQHLWLFVCLSGATKIFAQSCSSYRMFEKLSESHSILVRISTDREQNIFVLCFLQGSVGPCSRLCSLLIKLQSLY